MKSVKRIFAMIVLLFVSVCGKLTAQTFEGKEVIVNADKAADAIGDLTENTMLFVKGKISYYNLERIVTKIRSSDVLIFLDLSDTTGVQRIDDNAFSYLKSLAGIVLPNGLKKIGAFAFAYCDNLEVIKIPESVSEMAADAFIYCKSLENVEIPESSKFSVFVIKGNESFIGDTASGIVFQKVTVNTSDILTVIENHENNLKLIVSGELDDDTLIDIIAAIRRVEFGVYLDLSKTTGITQIGEKLKEDELGNYNYSRYTFRNSMLFGIDFPKTIETIGTGAFAECPLLNVTIPDSVTEIGAKAFSGCELLKSVNLPNQAKVEDEAFSDCYALESITVPESVTDIGSVFGSIGNLKEIAVDSKNTAYTAKNSVLYTKDMSILIKYSPKKTETSFTIPKSVKKIDDLAFYQCEFLENIIIPNSVTEIGKNAFYCCESLENINIPNSVTKIGERAFYCCESLESINIPDSVTEIGDDAFFGCSSLTSITIPSSITEINVFLNLSLEEIKVDSKNSVYASKDGILYTKDMTKLIRCPEKKDDNFDIPNSVTKIGEGAFSGCSSLENINIPDSVTEIGENAFYCCESLESINIPDSVTEIGENAFYCCKSLENINIPDSVTEIGVDAFFGCKSLENINIPNSVTKIGDAAFIGCTSLENINIPDSVTEMGFDAFFGCTSLENINIPNSVTKIGASAFSGCESLESINIPDSVTEIGIDAFSGCTSLKSVTISTHFELTYDFMERYFYSCKNLRYVQYGGTWYSYAPLEDY